MAKDFSVLGNLVTWLSLKESEQDRVVHDISQVLGNEYSFQYINPYSSLPSLRLATFLHLPTELEFILIVGGDFDMGFSLKEEQAAHRIQSDLPFSPSFMRPVHRVHVKPFLISKFPILDSFARENVELDRSVFRPEFSENPNDTVPIYLTRKEVGILMNKFGFRLPSEAQWEYACRGGTKTLFYFGDDLPDEQTLENNILVYNFNDADVCRKAANLFGLVGMSIGEWCEDSYRENYKYSLENDSPLSGGPPYVVRGGAASLWPWQGCDEWILLISAMRRSSETLEDETCGGRFVKLLDI